MKICIILPPNGSKFHWIPLGGLQVANALAGAGHNIVIIHADALNLSHNNVMQHLSNQNPDYVGMGWIAGRYPHDYCTTLSRLITREGYPLVLGGHAPSSDPEWYLDHTGATAVITGEADGVTDWDGISGVVEGTPSTEWWPYPQHMGAGMFYYPLVPAPGAHPIDRVAPVITGMGCPYKCSFCFRLTEGRRQREITAINDEIAFLKKYYKISFIQFQDELLMTSAKRALDICEMMRQHGLRWSCQGRVNVASKNPEILTEMNRAGCVFINYGVESVSAKVLRLMGKKQTPEQNEYAIQETLKAKISPGINMLWGCPGDDVWTLEANVKFIMEYSDFIQRRTIRPVTPYPGSPLYKQAVKNGVFKNTGDFYKKFINSDLITVNYMEMSKKRAHDALYYANLRLLKEYERTIINSVRKQAKNLYLDGDGDFRGWRQI